MEGMMCMYAEQETEGETMKWPSKDPCPWTSEKKKNKFCTVNTAAQLQPVPHFGNSSSYLQKIGDNVWTLKQLT